MEQSLPLHNMLLGVLLAWTCLSRRGNQFSKSESRLINWLQRNKELKNACVICATL